jgi:NTP pyrophosphatase (non-canonical NTP hydrolase)
LLIDVNENTEKIAIFEQKMGWNKTSIKEIMHFLKTDVIEMKEKNMKHKIGDIFFELIQLANRKNINLDDTLENHMKKTEKKYSDSTN